MKNHIHTLPFADDELILILEFARVAMGDAEWFDTIGATLDISDEFMREVRDKLQGFMDSTEEPEQLHAVCELICQKPSITVHPSRDAAMEHAVACAMENLYVAEDPENPEDRKESQERLYDMLTEFDRICSGDYEVHILTPTN